MTIQRFEDIESQTSQESTVTSRESNTRIRRPFVASGLAPDVKPVFPTLDSRLGFQPEPACRIRDADRRKVFCPTLSFRRRPESSVLVVLRYLSLITFYSSPFLGSWLCFNPMNSMNSTNSDEGSQD